MAGDVVVLAPAPLEARTGGYEYDRRMIAGLRARGWGVEVRELDPSFPRPTSQARDDAARQLAALPAGATLLVDGLAFGAMPSEAARESQRLRLVGLIHMPLAAAAGLDAATAAALAAGERQALLAARLVVVTGKSTVPALTRYGIRADRITVVEPGTDPAPRARGSRAATAGRLELLTVGSLTEGKGHRLLVRALGRLPDRAWHLTCAGSLTRDPAVADGVRAAVREDRLDDHVSFLGEVDRATLSACFDAADVFVLATLHETYGMAVAEALAHGLPVVSTTTGAIPELVGGTSAPASAGLLVQPGDEMALTAALSRILSDATLRATLADNAWRARLRLPGWDAAVDKMAAALKQVGQEDHP